MTSTSQGGVSLNDDQVNRALRLEGLEDGDDGDDGLVDEDAAQLLRESNYLFGHWQSVTNHSTRVIMRGYDHQRYWPFKEISMATRSLVSLSFYSCSPSLVRIYLSKASEYPVAIRRLVVVETMLEA